MTPVHGSPVSHNVLHVSAVHTHLHATTLNQRDPSFKRITERDREAREAREDDGLHTAAFPPQKKVCMRARKSSCGGCRPPIKQGRATTSALPPRKPPTML